MLIGSVVHDEIQNDADTALLALGDHAVEVGERAVHGVDVLVVGDVVTEIHLRRGEAGSDPYGIDAKIVQVCHLRGDAFQVADTVVVTVGKAAGVDLIEDRMLPPRVAFGVDRFSLGGRKRAEDQQERENRKETLEHSFLLRRETNRLLGSTEFLSADQLQISPRGLRSDQVDHREPPGTVQLWVAGGLDISFSRAATTSFGRACSNSRKAALVQPKPMTLA
jgi:hypothetical protein